MEKNLYMYNATMIYDISVYAYICVMCALSLTSCAYVFRLSLPYVCSVLA